MPHNNLKLKVDLAKLKSLVEQTKVDKIEKIIESLHERQDYTRYHYHSFKNILDTVNTDLSKFKLALQIDNVDKQNMLAIKANILACIQSLHVTHDILAFLIATVLDLGLDEREITFYNVEKKCNKFQDLTNLLNEFSNHEDYKYLVSYVNHSKHRFHIDPKFIFHFTGGNHFTATFEAFSFKNYDYESKEIDSFINEEYNREQALILQIENELINILESQGED